MSAERIRAMVQKSEANADSHATSVTFADFPDQKAILVLSCLDPRTNPSVFWDLPAMGGPGIIRNAGGRAEDALRSLRVISAITKKSLGAVAIVHHTDCGMTHFKHDDIAEKVKGFLTEEEKESGLEKKVDAMNFGEIETVEKTVREDMALVKADPFLPKDLEVVGYVYDVFTGKTTEVV